MTQYNVKTDTEEVLRYLGYNSLQPDIIRTLSADRLTGLTVSSSMHLIPTKSVTAFIGISDRPQPHFITGCQKCSMKGSCKFRKAGTDCARN